MGYRTSWNGKIIFPKNYQKKINAVTDLLFKLAKQCEFISSGSNKGTEYWFHEIDEWLGYLPIFEVEDGTIIFNDGGKTYDDSVPKFCLIIALICPSAQGSVDWDGEEDNDQGTINVYNGKVLMNGNEWQPEKGMAQKMFPRKENDTVRTPKYDFIQIFEKASITCDEDIYKWIEEQRVLNSI